MTTDLLIAIVLTASAAFVVWILSSALPGPTKRRIKLATALVAWFAVIVALGATRVLAPETLGTPAVGLVVVLPVVAFAILGTRIAGWREALMAIPLPALVAAHAVRVLGIFFLILHAQGRLPAPFAPTTGWGDIIIGATALPVAWMAATAMPGWRPVTLTWNALGLADLVTAIALGVTSAPDSPLPLFTGGPGTSVMSVLPMLLVPGFLVPVLMLAHFAVFYRLSAAGEARGPRLQGAGQAR